MLLYPRGPRSGPSYSVSGHRHLLAHPPHLQAQLDFADKTGTCGVCKIPCVRAHNRRYRIHGSPSRVTSNPFSEPGKARIAFSLHSYLTNGYWFKNFGEFLDSLHECEATPYLQIARPRAAPWPALVQRVYRYMLRCGSYLAIIVTPVVAPLNSENSYARES